METEKTHSVECLYLVFTYETFFAIQNTKKWETQNTV